MKTVKEIAILSVLATGISSGAIIFDMTFDHLAGTADGAKLSDGQRTEDSSGSRHHGFFSGGAQSIHHTTSTISGTSGVDFSQTAGPGGIIVRDNLADGGVGSPNAWWGAGNTPAAQPTIGAGVSWTIESVININSQSDTGAIISNNGGGSEWWWRVTGGGTLQALFADADTTTGAISHAVPGGFDSDWHHVALIFDRTAGEVRTYYDYSLIGTTAFTPADYGAIGNATRDLEIGQFDGTSARDFDGMMDQIRISDTVLATSEFIQIPEPATGSLLLLGGAMAGRRRR